MCMGIYAYICEMRIDGMTFIARSHGLDDKSGSRTERSQPNKYVQNNTYFWPRTLVFRSGPPHAWAAAHMVTHAQNGIRASDSLVVVGHAHTQMPSIHNDGIYFYNSDVI